MTTEPKTPVQDDANGTGSADTGTVPVRRRKKRLLMAILPAALVVCGAVYWLATGRFVSTDNAYVHQPMVSVSSDVSGRIVEVFVAENQSVAAGAPLFRIDPEPYRLVLDQAEAALGTARLGVAQHRADYARAEAQLAAAESILSVQKQELARQEQLTTKGVAPQSQLDEIRIAERSARNAVDIAQRELEAAAAALGGDPDAKTDSLPPVRAAIALRDAAARNLEQTLVRAATPGIVSQIDSLNAGQYLAAGSAAAMLIDCSRTWIVANFKETQLEGLAAGQVVEIRIDAYPGLTLHGQVESFASATGSQFALIPAQNATGNWVKVVQRVPVRIDIADSPAKPLRDGMSVHVSVDTGHSRMDQLL